MNDEQVTAAINATVAKTILESLDTEARDALLQKSIAEVIGGYKFRSAIDDVVSDKARRIAAELVETEAWSMAIERTLQEAFSRYLWKLSGAAEEVLKKVFHGEAGTYQQAALVLRCWPKPQNDAGA
jgi:hypothetical protein